jgi:phage terminase large subunit-like protein
LFVDGEPGAEIYGAASEYGQACMVFDQAMGMVRQNPVMAADCKMYLGQSKAIVSRDDPLTVYRVIAYSPKSLHGGNTHVAVVDELHCLPNRELVDVLNTSKGSRLQPIQIYLTTADYERPGSVCNEIHDKAKAVRDGSWDDPTFLPIIYEAAKDDDWTDPAIWAKANPNLGISFPQTYLEEQVHEAKRVPGFENSVKRLHLNIRTEQADKWISLAEWDRAKPFTFDPDELLGKECQAGFDLGYVSDLTVVSLGRRRLSRSLVVLDAARARPRRRPEAERPLPGLGSGRLDQSDVRRGDGLQHGPARSDCDPQTLRGRRLRDGQDLSGSSVVARPGRGRRQRRRVWPGLHIHVRTDEGPGRPDPSR